ncbi:MAG: hypothetical protein ACPG7X_03320 [Flavobacteriaceae bacterium]
MSLITIKTDQKEDVLKTIQTVDRLEELVTVVSDNCVDTHCEIFVLNDIIGLELDWHDNFPPYILPKVKASENNLLTFTFYALKNIDRSFEYLDSNNTLFIHFQILDSLQKGFPLEVSMLDFLRNKSTHNLAIVHALAVTNHNIPALEINKIFESAIDEASNTSERSFTQKHYINFLLDTHQLDIVKNQINIALHEANSEEVMVNFKRQMASCLLLQLKHPYPVDTLKDVTEMLEWCIAFYESKGLTIQAGLLLVDLGEVKNLEKDFPSSKDTINRAIRYFQEEQVYSFLGEALLQKASLLYSWSKSGSPQYYKASINAFQEALKIFTQEQAPHKYADIKHQLALIYSEIQVAENEKPIWSAFSAAAFKEALAIYKGDKQSYQYASIAHNYATALMGFPEAKLHDNMSHAFSLFEEALEIRNAIDYPVERALTLLNQLELLWIMNNENQIEEHKNLKLMFDKATEVIRLVNDQELLERAKAHLNALEEISQLN